VQHGATRQKELGAGCSVFDRSFEEDWVSQVEEILEQLKGQSLMEQEKGALDGLYPGSNLSQQDYLTTRTLSEAVNR
jgi:hypothetical protein